MYVKCLCLARYWYQSIHELERKIEKIASNPGKSGHFSGSLGECSVTVASVRMHRRPCAQLVPASTSSVLNMGRVYLKCPAL